MTRAMRTWLTLDALGNGDVQIAITRDIANAKRTSIITGIPKRQAVAMANRILHEVDFAEGKKSRRPGNPHLDWPELMPCLDCGRKNATPCDGRAGRTCPLGGTAAAAEDHAALEAALDLINDLIAGIGVSDDRLRKVGGAIAAELCMEGGAA